jgi:DNA polymerase III delta prime subunit
MNDVLGHDMITKYLTRCVENKKIPNLILHGEPGCGKTSTIHALAHDLYGDEYTKYVHEFNASDERGIAVVRNKIHAISKQTPPKIGFKLVVLDEADFLTNEAQAALRKIMEEYSDKTVFCLMCNYVHKIIRPIQSRCMAFYFQTVPRAVVAKRLRWICDAERLRVPGSVIESISLLCKGDLRTGISMLQVHSFKDHGDAGCDAAPTIDHRAIQLLEQLYTCMSCKDAKSGTLESCIVVLTDEGYSHRSIIMWLLEMIMKDTAINETTRQTIIPIISNNYHNVVIGCNGHIQTLTMCKSIVIHITLQMEET